MKLERTHYYFCFYSLFILFCGVQPSYSRLLRDSEKEEFSIMHPRILETTRVSCEADCISDVGNSEEHVAIVIDLNSNANYTLKFTIPDNGENFNLGIKSSNVIEASVFMQQFNSTKLVAFDHNWIQDNNGWMKIYVYGDTLRLYQGGKAILKLFNPSDQVETLTVEFHHNGLSTVVNIFLLIAVIVTCIIWLPIGQFLVAVVRIVVAKSKELCFGIKSQEGEEPRLLDTVMANKYSSQQAMEKPEDGQQVAEGRQMVEEDRYQDEKGKHHKLKDEEEVYDLQAAQARNRRENRRNHEAEAVPNKTQTAARKINLTVDNIKYCFPEAKYEDIKSKIPQPVCFLCFDQLVPGMYYRQLYCQHIFHAECIELWLQKQLLKKPDRAYCPNCKADMMTFESYKGKEQLYPIGDTLNL